MSLAHRILLLLTLLAVAALPTAGGARAAIVQQGPKLVPFDATPTAFFGHSVALSADGRTALAGAFGDSGAAWVLTRGEDGRWREQGPPLWPSGYVGVGWLGWSVALSADGNTALVSAPLHLTSAGGAWVFTRSHGVWSQDGDQLVPTDAIPDASQITFGMSVALSADGNTALVGAQGDAGGIGAAWVFARGAEGWSQQGKLRPDGEPGPDGVNNFGSSAALSADGSTALVGAQYAGDSRGAAWAFRRSGGAWTQDGPRLTPGDAVGPASFGNAVALSADGDVALIGGLFDDNARGAAWTFTRTDGSWSQSGPKLDGSGGTSMNVFGQSVALNADGDVALIGTSQGPDGSAWLYRRDDAGWSEQAVVTPSDAAPGGGFGSGVALKPDASTLLVGGAGDDGGHGAVWSFGHAPRPLVVPRMTVGALTSTIGPIPATAWLEDGDAPTGTITFRLYGPYPWGCMNPPTRSVTLDVDGNGAYHAEGLTADAFGIYRVLVSYSGDARNAPLAHSCYQHEFEVTERGSSSVRVEPRGSREVGAPLTLVPTFAEGVAPSGVLVVSLFAPSDPLCARAPLVRERLRAIGGRVPALTYAPTMTGRFTMTAFYAGDEYNRPSELLCGEATVTIERARPAIATSTSAPVAVGGRIGAAARVEGFRAGGAVTFLLYGPSDPSCARRPLATAGAPLVDGVAQSQAFATSETGTYHVTASYAGDRRNALVESACAAGAVVVAKRRPTLVVTAAAPRRGTLKDDATLHNAFWPSRNVRFTLYGRRDPRCRRRPVFTVLAPLDRNGHATTTPLGADPGRYQFVVRYGGDADNEAVATPCGANPVRVLRRHVQRRHKPRNGHR